MKDRPGEFIQVVENPTVALREKVSAIRTLEHRIEGLQRDVSAFDTGHYPIPGLPNLYVDQLKVRSVGNLSLTDEMLRSRITCGTCARFYRPTDLERHELQAEFMMSFGKSEAAARIKIGPFGERIQIYLRGISTTGLMPYSRFTLSGPFQVTGTKTIATLIDGDSMFVLEPYVLPGMVELIEQLREEPPSALEALN